MEVNEIRKRLQRIFDPTFNPSSFNRPLDPMDRITLGLELYREAFHDLTWIGVYLISHHRREMILGPFIGEPLEKVRYPLDRLSEPQGYWHSEPRFGWNGYQNNRWLGRLVCQGGLGQGFGAQNNLITLLGTAMDPWWGDCDHPDPFGNLPQLS